MRKNNTLVVGFCLSALAVSCSQAEHKDLSENKISGEKPLESVNKAYIDKNKIVESKINKNVERPALLGKKTVSFNGEKYLFNGEKLRKGSQVRSIHMSEIGTVKGTFVVVVAKKGGILDVPFKNKTKIAKDTFRLVPIQTDDLMAAYNELLLKDSIAIVELEVVYNGGESGSLEY